MKYKAFLLFTFYLVPLFLSIEVLKSNNENEIKIAFGSGNKKVHSERTKIFYSVARFNPDVWIWLGDVAYLDDRVVYGVWAENKNLTELKQRYRRVLNDPAYVNMKDNAKKILGIWNDHDFGKEGADASFWNKNHTKKLFLDFLGEPRGSERREHHEGVYNSYYLGEKRRVKLILLDVRFNKKTDDILGETQWKWLEKQLWENEAVVTIFASGMQIMPDDRYFTEPWDPVSREKLYKLIKKTNTKGPIFLSGDSGYAEIMQHPCSKKMLGLDLYEVTSNGLTYSMAEDIPFGQYFQTFLYPETYNKAEDRYNKKNFGVLEIRFQENSPESTQIHIEIRNDLGTSSISKYVELDSITADIKRKKEASKEECKINKAASYRRFAHILGRLKQFDIFFIFVLSLPFVTVWLVYISCKQFYEIFSTCCSDEDYREEEEVREAKEQLEEGEGEEEEDEDDGEEEKEEKEEVRIEEEKIVERKEESTERPEIQEEEEGKKVEERKDKEEEEWTVVKSTKKKQVTKRKKAKNL